jgi:NDP-sugar pyrophosphorylase family protein
MKAVILAGGLGSRLRPFTEVIPKPLLPLGERSIMETQILTLKSFGVTDVYIATNYKSDYVEAFIGDGSKYDVRLHFSKEKEPLGTCGPLALLKEEFAEPFIVLNGDILTKMSFSDFYAFAIRHNSVLTVATKIITTPFRFGNVSVDSNDHIIDVDEKPELKMEIVAGIYCMTPGIFEFIPTGEYYNMDALIKELLKTNIPIARYLIQDYWIDIGQVDDYSKAQEIYAKHFS